MGTRERIGKGFDGLTALLYIALVVFGWFNIFAAVHDPSTGQGLFALSLSSTKQLIWIGTSILLIIVILHLDYRSYETFSYIIYVGIILILISVILFGKEIKGSRSWFEVGGFRIQPSEFAKFITGLALAKYLSTPGVQARKLYHRIIAGLFVAIPAGLIVLQGDAGSALVFSAFGLVLYREKVVPNWILFGGIIAGVLFILALSVPSQRIINYLIVPVATIVLLTILGLKNKSPRMLTLILIAGLLVCTYIFSVNYIFKHFLEPHQKDRIMVLVDPDVDPDGRGVRWNLKQSLIAIGSGGIRGKGFLKGTQTELGYVPEQSTDFIFCTVGEEHGWIGSAITVGLFVFLLYRLVMIAERQRDKFVRIYGYSVASIIFFHFAVNIGMTIGLFPVVGIPLPFLSYGGSSLWGFTILLFILLKLDAHRDQQMERR